MSRKSKPISREEARFLFLNHMVGLINYWENESRAETSKAKLKGLMHSILCTFDGASCGMPGYALIPLETTEDIKYAKDQGYDHYPETKQEWGDSYDLGGSLHDELYLHFSGEKTKPENLYTFGDFLVDDAKRFGSKNDS